LLIAEYKLVAKQYDYLIISITTKGLSDLLPKIAESIAPHTHVILAMKGLTSNGLLPVDECKKYIPNHRISVLSGPGFAEEIMA
jgi:glycerol-3-phosphate dehydrogenase